MPLTLTPEQKIRFIQSKGLDPAIYDVDDETVEIVKKPTLQPVVGQSMVSPISKQTQNQNSAGGAFTSNLAAGIVPTTAALSAIPIGAKAGLAIGSFPLLIPTGGPIWGPIAGGAIAALGAGLLTSKVQGAAIEAVAPSVNRQLESYQQTNPYASAAGNVAAGLPLGLRFDPKVVGEAGKAISKLATTGRGSINAVDINALANVGVGAGIGTGMAAHDISTTGRDIGGQDAINILGNILLNNPKAGFVKNRLKFQSNESIREAEALRGATGETSDNVAGRFLDTVGLPPADRDVQFQPANVVSKPKAGRDYVLDPSKVNTDNPVVEAAKAETAKVEEAVDTLKVVEEEKAKQAAKIAEVTPPRPTAEAFEVARLKREAYAKSLADAEAARKPATPKVEEIVTRLEGAKTETEADAIRNELRAEQQAEEMARIQGDAPRDQPKSLLEETRGPIVDILDKTYPPVAKKDSTGKPVLDDKGAPVMVKSWGVTKAFFKLMQHLAKIRNATLEPNIDPATGKALSGSTAGYRDGKAVVGIGTGAGLDTIPHEVAGHITHDYLANSKSKIDRSNLRKHFEAIETSEAYAAWRKKLSETPEGRDRLAKAESQNYKQGDIDVNGAVEEFSAEMMGYDFLNTDRAISGETALQQSFRDIVAHANVRLREKPSLKDLRRHMAKRARFDAPYGDTTVDIKTVREGDRNAGESELPLPPPPPPEYDPTLSGPENMRRATDYYAKYPPLQSTVDYSGKKPLTAESDGDIRRYRNDSPYGREQPDSILDGMSEENKRFLQRKFNYDEEAAQNSIRKGYNKEINVKLQEFGNEAFAELSTNANTRLRMARDFLQNPDGPTLYSKPNAAAADAKTLVDVAIDNLGEQRVSKFLDSIDSIRGKASLINERNSPASELNFFADDKAPIRSDEDFYNSHARYAKLRDKPIEQWSLAQVADYTGMSRQSVSELRNKYGADYDFKQHAANRYPQMERVDTGMEPRIVGKDKTITPKVPYSNQAVKDDQMANVPRDRPKQLAMGEMTADDIETIRRGVVDTMNPSKTHAIKGTAMRNSITRAMVQDKYGNQSKESFKSFENELQATVASRIAAEGLDNDPNVIYGNRVFKTAGRIAQQELKAMYLKHIIEKSHSGGSLDELTRIGNARLDSQEAATTELANLEPAFDFNAPVAEAPVGEPSVVKDIPLSKQDATPLPKPVEAAKPNIATKGRTVEAARLELEKMGAFEMQDESGNLINASSENALIAMAKKYPNKILSDAEFAALRDTLDMTGREQPESGLNRESPQSELNFNDAAERKIAGANITRAMELLGSSMYDKVPELTIVKELVQNARDAVDTTDVKELYLHVNEKRNTINLIDTGKGMLPSDIVQSYLPAFVSGKTASEGAGGYGLAKIGLFGNANAFTIITRALTADGRMLETKLVGDGPAWHKFVNEGVTIPRFGLNRPFDSFDVSGMEMSSRYVEGLPSGTDVTIEPNKKIESYRAGTEFSNAGRYASRETFYLSSSYGDKRLGNTLYNVVTSQRSKYKELSAGKTNGAEISIAYDPTVDLENIYRIPVLNNGLKQFDMSFSEDVKLPPLIIDIKPTIDVRQGDYPFTVNRDAIKADTKSFVESALAGIADTFKQKQLEIYKSRTSANPRIEGSRSVFMDISGKLSPAEVQEITQNANIKTIDKVLKSAHIAIFDTLNKRYGLEWEQASYAGLANGGDFYGVRFGVPSRGSKGEMYYDLSLAIRDVQEKINTGRYSEQEMGTALGEHIAGTILHEAAHQISRYEGETHAREMTAMAGLVARDSIKLIKQLSKLYDNDNNSTARQFFDWYSGITKGKVASESDKDTILREGQSQEEQTSPNAQISGDSKFSSPRITSKRESPSSALNEDDGRLFVTSLEKELKSKARPFNLQVDKEGKLNSSEVLAQVNKLSPIEQELLKLAGLEGYIKSGGDKVSGQELATWLKENGPKVEVHNYGMEGNVSERKRLLDKIHVWTDANGYIFEQSANGLDAIVYRRNDPEKLPLGTDPLPHERHLLAPEPLRGMLDKLNQAAVFNEDLGLRATTAYEGVSAWDGKVPEWTLRAREAIAKGEELPENKQRVDVVIPMKPLSERQGFKDNVMWSPDGLHENLPNTLGWAMIQYTDSAAVLRKYSHMLDADTVKWLQANPDAKIAVMAEAQSQWAQKLRKQNEELKAETARAEARGLRMSQIRVGGVPNHPLLADTNRLIVKAAIDQAHKEGATHIFVSDAETAMITEGLDAHSRQRYPIDIIDVIDIFKKAAPNKKYKLVRSDGGRPASESNPMVIKSGGDDLLGFESKEGEFEAYSKTSHDHNHEAAFNALTKISKASPVIDQEGGMRFNYDSSYFLKDAKGESLTDKRFVTSEDAERYAQNVLRLKPASKYPKDWKGARDASDYIIAQGDLPSIASELTGDAGVRMSLGEHKNAFDENGIRPGNWTRVDSIPWNDSIQAKDNFKIIADKHDLKFNSSGWGDKDGFRYSASIEGDKVVLVKQEIQQVRQNLIFKNTDGTPKTDVTGRLYDISQPATRRDAGEQMTLTGKRFQPESSLRGVEPVLEELSRNHGPVGEHMSGKFRLALENETALRGQFANKALEEVDGLLVTVKDRLLGYNDSTKKIMNAFDYMSDNNALPTHIAMTPKEAAAFQALRDLFTKAHVEQTANGPMVARIVSGKTVYSAPISNPFYSPHITASDAVQVLMKKPASIEAQKLRDDFRAYRILQGQTHAEIDAALIKFQPNKSGASPVPDYNAVRYEEGLGLPKSWREKDLSKVMRRYYSRWGTDMGFYRAIQSDPIMRRLLDINDDGQGNIGKGHMADTLLTGENIKEVNMNSTPEVQTIMRDFNKSYPMTDITINSINRLVKAFMMQTATGTYDVVTALPIAAKLLRPGEVGLMGKAMLNWKHGRQVGYDNGTIRRGAASVQDLRGLDTGLSDVMDTLSSGINKVTGRESLEGVARGLTNELGYLVNESRLSLARNGSTADIAWYDSMNVKDWQTRSVDDIGKEVAARFTELNQGTYDVRGLPRWAIEGSLSPFFSLAKWNIEQFNNWNKTVINPARSGNYTPLLMSTVGAIIGGAAVEEVRKLFNNRKPVQLTNEEWWKTGEDTAYKLAALASLSGYAGILGEVTKTVAMDMPRGNRPHGFTFPLVETIANTADRVSQLSNALGENITPSEALIPFIQGILTDNIQMARVGARTLERVTDPEKAEQANANRDRRVYKQAIEGEYVNTSSARTNPMLRPDERVFKKTASLEEAATILPKIVEDAVKRSGGDYEKLQEEFNRMKGNNIQSFPSPETSPVEFAKQYAWLVQSQGKEAADKAVVKFMQQREINKEKSKWIPKI